MKKRALVLGLVGILAMSGLSFAATNNSTISKSKAEKIAMAKVPNGKIERVYLDKEDSEYNIFIKKGNAVYEVEVNSLNGKITDIDRDDNYYEDDYYDDDDHDDYDDDDYYDED